MFERIALAWPSQLKLPEHVHALSDLQDIAVLIRTGKTNPSFIESLLLSRKVLRPVDSQDCLILLCWLYFVQCDKRSYCLALKGLREIASPSRLEVRIMLLVWWLWNDEVNSIATAPKAIWSGESKCILLQLCRASYLLKAGKNTEAASLLSSLKKPLPLEALILQAQLQAKASQHEAACLLLKPLIDKAPNHLRLFRQLLIAQIDSRDGAGVLAVACAALKSFGEHPEFLYLMTTLNLFQRHPGLARRSVLLQQVWISVRSTPSHLGNQINTYEMNGQVNWIENLLDSVRSIGVQADPEMHSNLCMQLASIQSMQYRPQVETLLSNLRDTVEFQDIELNSSQIINLRSSDSSLKRPKPIRIGWITGDLTYHPVARFLYSFFASGNSSGDRGEASHSLVSLVDHGSDSAHLSFSTIPSLSLLNFAQYSGRDAVSRIRDLSFDVAVDLSGWTGGNFMAGFLARLAPVQVNYLGYFASTGLPSMDYWLGDHSIFLENHQEWSTEKLWRLDRPFLAWQPADPLPEASIGVMSAPSGPVRFGSFNHNRKLSDQTLRLWADLLNSVPGSRLVLKASSKRDSDTQRILRRRMLRQGLDPERVDWLALTRGPVEHMQQYAHIDIALDPIPNGGCTTTCEALWMGVPTITLAGSNYVSRMSTAVMTGANMPEWVAHDRAGYINLALENAARLVEIRAMREHWRFQLQNSPLGDASDLMNNLEAAFSQMKSEVLSRN